LVEVPLFTCPAAGESTVLQEPRDIFEVFVIYYCRVSPNTINLVSYEFTIGQHRGSSKAGIAFVLTMMFPAQEPYEIAEVKQESF